MKGSKIVTRRKGSEGTAHVFFRTNTIEKQRGGGEKEAREKTIRKREDGGKQTRGTKAKLS
jgi:hypothetical protein